MAPFKSYTIQTGVGVYPKIGYYSQISLEVSTIKQKK
jgi:hypothetical protein